MVKEIKALANSYFKEIVSVRRFIHAHPELSFEEYRTSEFIREKLDEFGVDYKENIAGTGIIAQVNGKNPKKKNIALRAELDAIPVTELTKVSYKSKNPGVMHACGHDVHAASLLGACKILYELRDQFEGSVKFIFQPGEEKFPGGAKLMIKEGVLKNPKPKSILGQHVYSRLPVGSVGFRSGLTMASADEITLRVKGRGGHAAVPQRSVDPVPIAAQIITASQQLISRMCDPTIPSVLTFGNIQSVGGTFNVIPAEVILQGTFRTFSEYWRFKAHDKLKELVKNIAKAFNADAELDIQVGYPFLVNNKELTDRCRHAAIEYLGANKVMDIPLRLTSEDFAYYTHEVHGCFYRLGIANDKKGIKAPVHSPYFNVDENALKTGMGLMSYLAYIELMN